VQAATCAREVGKPVQVIWSRDEDFKQDKYRPAASARMAAALDAKGKVIAWHARLASQSAGGSFGARYLPKYASDEPDIASVQGATKMPYDIPAVQVSHALAKLPIPVGFWRSVGHSSNAFFVESFMDETAHGAGMDPVAFRLSMLEKSPRHARVLQECVARAGPKSEGRGRGYALHESFGSIVAQAADVAITSDGAVEVKRVVCVVDCGKMIHPDTVAGQMEGGIIFGLSAALFGKIDFDRGMATVENFDGYPLLTLAQTPDIEVHVIESGAPLGGIGEVAVPPIAPAVTNAIFDITGIRIRKLPLAGQKLLTPEQIKERQALEASQGGVAVDGMTPGATDDALVTQPAGN
jgi:isoquinoline 1-oxidoreductase subunit beta